MAQVYKVVRREGDNLLSAVFDQPLVVTYPLGEWAKCPEGMPLLAFTRFSEANSFLRGLENINYFVGRSPHQYELYEAEADGLESVHVLSRADDLPTRKQVWSSGMYKKAKAEITIELTFAPK